MPKKSTEDPLSGELCEDCEHPLRTRKKKRLKNKSGYGIENYCVKCQSDKMKRQRMKIRYNIIDDLGAKCTMCGYDKNYAALVFHHLDPSIKSFQLSADRVANKNIKLVMEEVAKCILICHNCHSELHHPDCAISEKVLA